MNYVKMLSYFEPFPHKKFCLCCFLPRRPRDAKCIHSCSVLMFLVECGIEWRAGKENHWHEKELILLLFLLFCICILYIRGNCLWYLQFLTKVYRPIVLSLIWLIPLQCTNWILIVSNRILILLQCFWIDQLIILSKNLVS